jgi:hypothetical protein
MGTNDRQDDTRYGHRSGSGSNEPKDHEKKEQRSDWQPRQGGDQTRTEEGRRSDEGRPSDEAQGERTKSPASVATRPHLEGSEQGPA